MMNAAFSSQGIDAVYLAFRVPPERIGEAIAAMRVMGIGGANVTAPLKEAVAGSLDELAPDVITTGSVNTIVVREGRLVGHNTDGVGLVRAIEEGARVLLSGRRVLLLGAGGAARGVLPAIARAGASYLYIANRTKERAEILVSDYLSKTTENIAPAVEAGPLGADLLAKGGIGNEGGGFDIVINATRLPFDSDEFLGIDLGRLKPGGLVFDMNYTGGSEITSRLKDSLAQKGIHFVDGLSMLLYQGASSFSLWTGTDPPIREMKSALGA